MKIIVTGATGMVGAEVIRQAILDKDIEEITAIVRKPLSITHPKLKTVIHNNFLDYSELSDVFKANDACIWCLGISQSQVNKEEYVVITYDYMIAAANEMIKDNPGITLMFLSGEGADQTEKSRFVFGRIKGRTEKKLQELPFKKLYIARPAGIKPVHHNPNAPLAYKLFAPLFPIIEFFSPNSVIHSDMLAKAMIQIIKKGYDKVIFDNKELRIIGRDKY